MARRIAAFLDRRDRRTAACSAVLAFIHGTAAAFVGAYLRTTLAWTIALAFAWIHDRPKEPHPCRARPPRP